MGTIGTKFSSTATKVLLLGSGELGKELVIELQRLGVEVIACDRYTNAPAMQVADRSYTFSMLDSEALRKTIESEKPDLIVPEIEAIATDTLVELETEGFTVIPSAHAARLTMNREGIRRLAAEDLGLATTPFEFAASHDDFLAAVDAVGMPCVVKPIMSSSGKGQSTIKCSADIESAWAYAQEGGRAGAGKVIVEGFIDFDYEITLLTVRHDGGVSFCEPIGHRQEEGDYRESWQPQQMSETAINKSKHIASRVTEALGGRGIFGVELFVKGEEVYFLAKVNVVKQTTSTVFAQIDSGFNHLIRPMLYGSQHEIFNISNPKGRERFYSVVGYICETDTFANNRRINEINEGDILCFKNAGAYCFSMASNYNSRYRPAEVLIHNGDYHLIRKRETFDDLVTNQLVIDL